MAFAPGTADQAVARLSDTRLLLFTPASESTLLTQTRRPGLPSAWAADYRNALRLFTGRPDPADAARFTVPYTLGGVAGEIVGRLLPSDDVVLEAAGPLAELTGGRASESAPSPPDRVATGRPATRPGR